MSVRQDKGVNVQVLLRCRTFSDDELRSNAPQVVTCNDYQREVAVSQNIAGKQIDRVFTFDKYGMIKEEGSWMPVDPDTEITRGYCFIEYSTVQEAVMAKDERHGYKLDKNHVLAVNLMDDFDRLVNVPEAWSAPEAKPYSPGENLQEWLSDEKGRSQFLIRAGSDTEVLWNDPMQPKPEVVQHVCSQLEEYKLEIFWDAVLSWKKLFY